MRPKVAGPDGICWLTPDHLLELLKSRGFLRLSQPRSCILMNVVNMDYEV
jgi:hypothetical protein